jgi:SAM-dependent methyltransferase
MVRRSLAQAAAASIGTAQEFPSLTRVTFVDIDLAGFQSGHPERFVPALMGGVITAGEHFSRYRWAAQIVRGKRVLDAACGVGYGSKMFAEAGAREVVGIDSAAEVLDAVRGDLPSSVSLVAGDVTHLPFESGSFDVVACFETIEHVVNPAEVLDEFARVLTADGVLVISTPNRRVFTPGNPHHDRELTPEELEELLTSRFANVRLVRQHDWLATAILEDESFCAGVESQLEGLDVRKLEPGEPGQELYTLALAGSGPLPSLRGTVVLAEAAELKRWQERVDELERVISDQQEHIASIEEARPRDEAIVLLESELRARSFDLEQRDRSLAQLSRRLFALERSLARRSPAEAELAALRATRLFRYTAGLRALYRKFRRLHRS